MRTFGTILALLLIFFGLVVAGLVVVRIWQDNGQVRVDVNTANVSAPTPTVPVSAAVATVNAAAAIAATANTAVVAAANAAAANGEAAGGGTQPLVVGVESGGMSLSAQAAVPAEAANPAAVQGGITDQPAPLPPAPPTVDPCPPAPAQGFAADTAVVAVGTLRVYSQTDVMSPALRELSAGQGLWIVTGEDGSTAIKRCDVIWQRVRTADGLVGWVLEDAVDVIRPTVVTPTTVPTAMPTATTMSPCVGGCGQPGCVQPCPTPCYQPCPTPCYQSCPTPCYQPCGVYTK